MSACFEVENVTLTPGWVPGRLLFQLNSKCGDRETAQSPQVMLHHPPPLSPAKLPQRTAGAARTGKSLRKNLREKLASSAPPFTNKLRTPKWCKRAQKGVARPAWEGRWEWARGQRWQQCLNRDVRAVVLSRFINKPSLSLGLHRAAALAATSCTPSQVSLFSHGFCHLWASYPIPSSAPMDSVYSYCLRINCQGAEINHVYCGSILTAHSPLMKHSSQM